MPAPPKRTVGQIEVVRELGRGGMGVVRVGHQPGLERPVVLKTLRRGLAEEPGLEERFLREARTAAAVHHQNVVAVYDCVAWRGERVIVQEYVEGVDLSTVLEAVGDVEPRIAMLIALEVVRGLEEIHSLGIVHRDLKPSNILISRRGAVKIADFGIALGSEGPGLTRTGHAVGTPPYMSPEQLLGETADARSDLFSLGVMLYEMGAGRVPFELPEEDGGARVLVRQVQAGRFPSLRRIAPRVPRRLGRLVARCLAARPRRRPRSSTDVREILERCVGGGAPGDCRAEIAAWLWSSGLFEEETGEGGTVAVARPARRRRSTPVAWIAATACVVIALLGAATLADRSEWARVASLWPASAAETAAATSPAASGRLALRPEDASGR
jgi:serine/threonine-protein kinase